MPVNPIVTDVAEVRVHLSIDGTEEAMNVLNFNVGATPTDADLQALIDAVANAYADKLQPFWSDKVVMDDVVATFLGEEDGSRVYGDSTTTGALTTAPLPYQTALVVSWKTATRGKSYQGRTYLAGFTEANSDGANPDDALIGGVLDWCADIMAIGTGPLASPLTIVSRYEPNPTPPPSSVPRATNLTTTVTAYRVDRVWKTQRRRAL